jgi:hypothetical protein
MTDERRAVEAYPPVELVYLCQLVYVHNAVTLYVNNLFNRFNIIYGHIRLT